MKIPLKDIVNNIESLKTLQGIKFEAKISYRIKRLIDKLDPILKTYNEKRNELVSEFGTKAEDGTTSVTEPEKLTAFLSKLNELLAVEENIEFEPISINSIGDTVVAPKDLVSFVFEE